MSDLAAAQARSPSAVDAAPHILAITAIAGLSGFAGLGYEMVWTRMLAVALGHEIVAVLGVISALFAGLALGGLVPGRRISASARPALWYAGLEAVIGLWALALIALAGPVGDLVPVLAPVDATPALQWFVAFALPFLLLLPATLAMGATLPALEAILSPALADRRAAGRVYAANTAGAVAGTLATAFLVIPAFGLSATLALCALVNAICAIAMLRAAGGIRPVPKPEARGASIVGLAPLFVSGLLGIGYEVLTVRVLSQILENTVYTFAILLAAYLAGTALGAALRNRVARGREPGALIAPLVVLTALACMAGAAVLGGADMLLAVMRAGLPATVSGRLGAEVAIAAIAFVPPTLAMGALFTELAQAASDRWGGMGPALAANTFGAALAPIVFGPVLMPLVGAKIGFAVIALGYLLALPNLRWRTLALGVAAGAAVALFVLSPLSLRFVRVPPGGALLWHADGAMASVSVVRNSAGDVHLQVNNHFRMGGSASERSDHRQAHIPLLLHPDPRRALFLGLGTGATLSAAGDHPGLKADGVELVPEVVETFPLFARSAPQLTGNPDISIHVADARRFVRAGGAPYDVIVADLYHPSVDGSGALYSREHFAAIRGRLAPGGLFAQWLPLHQLDLPTLRLIVRTFLEVFPQGEAYLGQFSVETPLIVLVGRTAPARTGQLWLAHRVTAPELARRLGALDLKDDVSLFGLYLSGAGGLRAFAGPGPVNSDDHPRVASAAPRTAYAAGESPGERLVSLIAQLDADPAQAMPGADAITQQRLAAYWRARNLYLETGVATLTAKGPRNVVAGIAPKLVEIVRISPDFEPAYLPVIAMARQVALSDPSAARALLTALDRAQPRRPEARRALASLPPG